MLEQAPSAWPDDASEHLARCEHCAARRAAIESARGAFLEQRPALELLRAVRARAEATPPPTRPRMLTLRRVALGASLFAAAALLMLVLRPAPPSIRFKGAPAIEVYVKRGTRSAALRDGDALGAGDHLGFVYSLPKPRHLLLLSIDDTGAISRYFPVSDGAGAEPPLSAGARAQLPIGVELDAHRGEERLIALFADAPLDEAQARDALRAAFEQIRARKLGLAALPKLELAGADEASVWFRKP
jgi:hypothetical protein